MSSAPDALWEAEFRGFFWGEGCLTVHYYRKYGSTLFRPAIKVAVRGDDGDVLLDCQRRLGGHIFWMKRKDRSYPMCSWDVVKRSELQNIVRILEGGCLPSKKRREVELFKQYLEMAHTQGHKYTPEEKARVHEIHLELRRLKQAPVWQDGQAVSA